jgi:hypothetical protein
MKSCRTHNALFAAAVTAVAAACPANAALTELQITADTTYTGYVTGPGVNNEDAYLTAFSAQQIGGDVLPYQGASQFYTFCIDLAPDLIFTSWWQSGTLPLKGSQNGNTYPYVDGGIQRAASLYEAYVGEVNFSSAAGKEEGAALQLAIWKVLYDTGTDVTTGSGFKVSGAEQGVTTLANSMLSSSANFADYNLTSTFWNAMDSSGNAIFNQDLIGPQFGTSFRVGSAPEPRTYAVVASACAFMGLVVSSRKSSKHQFS